MSFLNIFVTTSFAVFSNSFFFRKTEHNFDNLNNAEQKVPFWYQNLFMSTIFDKLIFIKFIYHIDMIKFQKYLKQINF